MRFLGSTPSSQHYVVSFWWLLPSLFCRNVPPSSTSLTSSRTLDRTKKAGQHPTPQVGELLALHIAEWNPQSAKLPVGVGRMHSRLTVRDKFDALRNGWNPQQIIATTLLEEKRTPRTGLHFLVLQLTNQFVIFSVAMLTKVPS